MIVVSPSSAEQKRQDAKKAGVSVRIKNGMRLIVEDPASEIDFTRYPAVRSSVQRSASASCTELTCVSSLPAGNVADGVLVKHASGRCFVESLCLLSGIPGMP